MNFKDIENLSDIISNQPDSTKEIFDKLFHKAVRLCMEGLKVEINFQKVTSDTIRVKLTVPENDDNISHSLFCLESDNSQISENGQYIDIPVNNIDNPEVCDSFMPKIDRIIQNNMQDSDFSVDALAQEMNMSRTALYAKFKSLNENTIASYINDFRLRRAQSLLRDSLLSISEISEQTGFSSQRYFSSFFKKQTGKTPSAFRSEKS